MPAAYAEHGWRSSDGLSLYYRDYPGPDGGGALPALCLPGLTRNSRDFEDLALHLAKSRRVLSPELRGRGRSDYDPEPKNYHPGTYVRDLVDLLEAAGAPRVVAVGTSLGGLLSMLLASAKPEALAGVVLNDIGPELDPAGVARIRGYVGKGGPVSTWEEAAGALRELNAAAFPELGPGDWLEFARRTYVEGEDGKLRTDYDPHIADTFADTSGARPSEGAWAMFAGLDRIPTLALRGALSDILSERVFAEMQRRKPDLVAVTVPERGHAPLLDEPACLTAIDRFLKSLDRG